MRVQLDLVVACPADVAWRVITSSEAAARAYAPLISMVAESPLPERWHDGDEVVVRLLAGGVVPAGRQLIALRTRRRGDTRILEDAGRPLSGPLAIVTGWRHRMAVTPLPGGRTRYRDRLDVSAGVLTPVAWFGLWLVWRARGASIRRLLQNAAR